jgi:ABC-type multidrug transport system ATPase subunit
MLSVEVPMRLEAVGKRYGVRQPWVVRDVSVTVAAGQLIRVEGRNGSGKSTLLRVVAGVTSPSRGRVTGRPQTGYVPERFPGGLPFSGREYLLHMARIHGLRGDAGRQRVDEWLQRLGAADYAARPLRDLSKGMCQKIAISQALLPRSGLLVLDEAWTGLDQAARATLDDAVLERAADGGLVIFVDHDQARLAGRADERWRFDGAGRVQIAPGDTVAEAATDQGAWQSAGTAVVVIELAGVEGDSLSRLGKLPGVLSAAGVAAAGTAAGQRAEAAEARMADQAARRADQAAAGPGHAVLRVAEPRSDEVLREVLAWDGVHVAGVHAAGNQGPRP